MLPRFKQNITEKNLFSPTDRLLVAVSGGVDSVVLCDLCHRAGFVFEIAHANFQLRGEDSTADECFVRELAVHYRVPIHVKQFDPKGYAEKNKCSVQVAARELRYAWFRELMQNGLKVLLTAHHADDNIETVLMNFFRGTGISGLRGMLEKHDSIVRPLLHFHKKELLAYASENKLRWREDISNSSDKYSRNYFRNAVIPMVYKIYPEAEENILQNIERFHEADELYRQAVAHYKKKLLEFRGDEVHVPVLKLKKASPVNTILYEVISDYNFTSHQLHDVVHLLDAEQGKFVQSTTHRIFVNRGWLIISPRNTERASNILIEEGTAEVKYADKVLTIQRAKADGLQISGSRDVAQLDHRAVKFPLCLRKWKAGDYFYPLGMKKKKKVSRFLIDQKLSPTQKEKVWVLQSGNRICWVMGMRIDERFKITDSTKDVLVIKT
ncbi:MAG: tRNA lysidine(34) synthetase TilS [Chitinophagaceae bacterium]|nr:tRNA lysidine(34) synthetase TilS [Chitinophagaceae bacterium]